METKESAMAKIGLFYGSTTGDTLKVAELIQEEFGDETVDLIDVASASAEDLNRYEALIFGTSTWHWGGLQDEWAIFQDSLTEQALKGKKVALFGLGDQRRYADNFVDGIGLLHEKIKPMVGQVVGKWPKNGYDYKASAADEGDHLVGLAIDQDNEASETPTRVKQWVEQVRKEFQ
jgi:flavodoxin I